MCLRGLYGNLECQELAGWGEGIFLVAQGYLIMAGSTKAGWLQTMCSLIHIAVNCQELF